MAYNVLFVGLTCFWNKQGELFAYLPDGRFPSPPPGQPQIQPHLASISVRTHNLVSATGWRDEDVTSDPFETEFFFPPSTITFPSTDPAAPDVTGLTNIPLLQHEEPTFRIHGEANWIGKVPLRGGSIATRRLPNVPDDGFWAFIAQWTVPEQAAAKVLTIEVTARKGWPIRTITVDAGSDIALVNTSRGLAPKTQPGDHFELYAELCPTEVHILTPTANPKGAVSPLEPSASEHPTFRTARPASLQVGCTPVNGGTGL